VERGQINPGTQLAVRWAPMQSSGDHQMEHQPKIGLEPKNDSLPEPAQRHDLAPPKYADGRLDAAEKKGAADLDLLDDLTQHTTFQRVQVECDVRQFSHASRRFRFQFLVRRSCMFLPG